MLCQITFFASIKLGKNQSNSKQMNKKSRYFIFMNEIFRTINIYEFSLDKNNLSNKSH
jgi:hypothetical protein